MKSISIGIPVTIPGGSIVRVEKIKDGYVYTGYDISSMDYFWKIHQSVKYISIWNRIRLRLFGIIRHK